MKGKLTKFSLFRVLLHGSCTYFFFKKERLQPFKLQSNCHPGKRDWFIFLKLKIMFTDGDNYRASFWKFQIQSITTLQAQEFKNMLQNPRLLNSKLDQASKMSYLGVHGIRSLKWLNSSKGNRWNGVNFYLKITRFGVCSSRGWAW